MLKRAFPTLTFHDLDTHNIVLASFIDNEVSSSVSEIFSLTVTYNEATGHDSK